MSVDNTKVVYRDQPGTAAAQLYQSPPAGSGEIIAEIRVVNTSGGAATATLYLLPSGVSAVAPRYAIMYNKSITNGDYLVDAATLDMAPGDALYGLQNTSGALTVTVTTYQK